LENQGRLVLFLILSMLILFASTYFMPAPPPPQASQVLTTPGVVSTPGLQTSPALSLNAFPESTKSSSSKMPPVAVATFTVETDEYVATFTNQGALLTGFALKKYPNRQTQKPIQLVDSESGRPKPFQIDYAAVPDADQRIYRVEGMSSSKLIKPGDTASLSFMTVNEGGTQLTKTFHFKNGSYLIDFEFSVSQLGRSSLAASPLAVQWADTLGLEEITGTQSRVRGYRVATLAGDHVSSETLKKSQESTEIPAPISWTALANQFFVAALIPDLTTGGASVRVVRDTHPFKTPTEENPNPGLDINSFNPRPVLVYSGQALQKGQSFMRKGELFFGPQDYSLLKSLHLQLESVVDFGMFGFISVYMLSLLKWFFAFSHNWGLAILLLSVSIKLLLWFPTHSSYKNMYLTQQKMKEIQPKLEALKRKYPDDKQKQQEETMKLYQQAGINPLGGCLPLFFQMPVFFALYATLGHCIELRGANFLWLSDLTLMDKSHVFPLLMGVSMIVQQKVSGQASNMATGQQKFMMWFFPVFLTIISLQWPSGLLLYWMITNVLSIVQQKIVNREIKNARKKVEA
jgi:YidC/Oxa1 family membrane protein insertase